MTDDNTVVEMASAMGEFAQTVSDLAGSDLGKSVSHSLEALAELERKRQNLPRPEQIKRRYWPLQMSVHVSSTWFRWVS